MIYTWKHILNGKLLNDPSKVKKSMIILNNNRIKIEYKTNSFKKLAIIGQGAGGRERLSNDINHMDVHEKMFSKELDIIMITAKDPNDMLDIDLTSEFKQIQEICNLYEEVNAFIQCGLAACFLVNSKNINYKTVVLDSPRFLSGYTKNEWENEKFNICDVYNLDNINQIAKYELHYNSNVHYDKINAMWLKENIKDCKLINYAADSDIEKHPLKNILGLKTYLKVFIPSLINRFK